MNLKENLHWRLLYAILGSIIFLLVGNYGPQAYYRYIDKTQYIRYVDEITFDKKVYHPCDPQTAKTDLMISINSNIGVKSRLYLTLDKGDNEFLVIKEYSFDTFLKAQPGEQSIFSTIQLPCDLAKGDYFYRGVLTYSIYGVEKTAGFDSEVFSVDDGK